jgi:hypothetical protein
MTDLVRTHIDNFDKAMDTKWGKDMAYLNSLPMIRFNSMGRLFQMYLEKVKDLYKLLVIDARQVLMKFDKSQSFYVMQEKEEERGDEEEEEEDGDRVEEMITKKAKNN